MASDQSDELQGAVLERLFRVRRTVFEMLDARGYDVTADDLKMDFEQFASEFKGRKREDLWFLVGRRDEELDQIMVFWTDEAKLSSKGVDKFERKMSGEKVSRAIVVLRDKITPMARQSITKLRGVEVYIECFTESELLINITKHKYVPTHKLLKDSEKKKLLEKYHLKETQLPRILPSDPVSRFYGLTRGQVVKIVRPSETAGRYVTYRIVM